MRVFQATVIEPVGFHARPAAVAASQAGHYACQMELRYKDRTADMKSIIQIMKMGIPCGGLIEIRCEGADEAAAADSMAQVLKDKKVIC